MYTSRDNYLLIVGSGIIKRRTQSLKNIKEYICSRTKIMIKHPRTVFEIEDRLVTKHALATKIQSAWRGYVARQRYVRLVKSEQTRRVEDNEMIMKRIVFVQANVRRMLAVRAYRRTRAAVQTIKKYY